MDEKIVVLRNGRAVTATKYINGKKVNSTTAKCHPDDKFDFNIGAKIAVDRLIKENNNTDRKALDKTLGEAKEEIKQKIDKLKEESCCFFWDCFKKGENQVKVTCKNIESFLRVAKDKGFEWSHEGKVIETIETIKKYFGIANEIYIIYKNDLHFHNNGLQFSIMPLKNKTVVDWNEILPLFQNRIVYSSDFRWDRFLNGEIVVEMQASDYLEFSIIFRGYKYASFLNGNISEDDLYANHSKNYNDFIINNQIGMDDLIWCKVKDNKIVFSKAHTRNFGFVPNSYFYKYNGVTI